jgi:pentatricopeptide repeat protein
MSTFTNAANFGTLENYISDVAVTLTVGIGYYLFKGLRSLKDKNKNKNENKYENDEGDFSDPKSSLRNLKGKLEGALERWNYAKSIDEYNELIKNNYEKDGIEDPFKIINLINKNGITPNIDTYNALLLNCFKKNDNESAELLKEEILDNCGPVFPNNFTLNVLIKGLNLKYKNLRKNLFINNNNNNNTNLNINKEELFLNFDRELILLLKTLEDKNIYMDLVGQNTILDSLVDQGRLNEAWAQYTSMKKKFKPDMFTFSTILKGIKRTPELSCDWLDKAFLILNEAKMTDEIDETFLNTLLDSCVKFNRIDKAENLFENFENFGKKKTLTEHSYSIMIKGFTKFYKMEKAEEIFMEIKKISKENNKKISIITYGAMLNCYTRCKNIQKAENLFKEIEQEQEKENLEINSYIYSTLINGYRMNRKYEKAIELFDKILLNYRKNKENKNKNKNNNSINNSLNENPKENENPEKNMNIVLFNSILDCCVEANKLEKMEEIFRFLEDEQKKENFSLNIKIDLITYSIMIKGYAKGNKIEKVSEIYEKISHNKGFILDEMLYNTILDCYAKQNDENSAMKIYEIMKKNQIKISVVTFGVLIKLYLNLNQPEKAFKLFEENMMISDTEKEKQKQNENDNDNQKNNAKENLNEKDLINLNTNNNTNYIKPSVIIFQMLIKNLIKNQKKIEEAINLFKKMENIGTPSDSNIYDLIIKGCLEYGKFKEAGEFILEALKKNIKIENFLITSFVENFDNDINFTYYTPREKSKFTPKLIEALNTKSKNENSELNVLKILKKIHLNLKAEKQKIKGNSIYGEINMPNSSIYNNNNSNDNSINNKESEKKNSVGVYNFSSNTGIADLKGYNKNFTTISNINKNNISNISNSNNEINNNININNNNRSNLRLNEIDTVKDFISIENNNNNNKINNSQSNKHLFKENSQVYIPMKFRNSNVDNNNNNNNKDNNKDLISLNSKSTINNKIKSNKNIVNNNTNNNKINQNPKKENKNKNKILNYNNNNNNINYNNNNNIDIDIDNKKVSKIKSYKSIYD